MKYRVILENPAKFDLHGILQYITNVLKAPVAARRIYQSIKTQIKTLEEFPQRCKLVDDELLAVRGVRSLSVENYIAFFVIDESAREVHVLRVLYSRREWQKLL
jgi:plasmid stabilization system protein ParE